MSPKETATSLSENARRVVLFLAKSPLRKWHGEWVRNEHGHLALRAYRDQMPAGIVYDHQLTDFGHKVAHCLEAQNG